MKTAAEKNQRKSDYNLSKLTGHMLAGAIAGVTTASAFSENQLAVLIAAVTGAIAMIFIYKNGAQHPNSNQQ